MAHRNPPPLFSHSPAPPPLVPAHTPPVAHHPHSHSHSAGHNKENPHYSRHAAMPLVAPAPPSPALSSHSHSSSHHSTHHHHHRPPASPTKAAPTTAVNHYVRPLGGSGLAQGGGTAFSHRPPHNAAEPTMTQLLATQGTALGHYASPRPLAHHTQSGGDATMGNATGVLSWRKGQGFKEWEKVKLASPEVKRKADVAQLCASPSTPSPRRAST